MQPLTIGPWHRDNSDHISIQRCPFPTRHSTYFVQLRTEGERGTGRRPSAADSSGNLNASQGVHANARERGREEETGRQGGGPFKYKRCQDEVEKERMPTTSLLKDEQQKQQQKEEGDNEQPTDPKVQRRAAAARRIIINVVIEWL